MWKTTYREIRQSFGRYAAILAIVALGVGFFVGLMVVTPAMVRNGGRYLNNHDLYDLRLLSTLGFEKDSVDAFTGREDVKAVEGAVSSDFLAVDESGKSRVLVAQTLLEVQNQVELKAGRLPEAADEIVMDSSLFSKDDIGKTIQVSDENPEETADLFAYDVYTIVGIADASYYINYQRGSTTLGTGRVPALYTCFRMDLIRIIIRKFLSGSIRMTGFTVTFTRRKNRRTQDLGRADCRAGGAEPLRQPESRCAAEGGRCAEGAAGSDGGCAYRSGRGEAEADRRAKRACRRQRADRGRKKAAGEEAKQTLAQKQTELNNGRALWMDAASWKPGRCSLTARRHS